MFPTARRLYALLLVVSGALLAPALLTPVSASATSVLADGWEAATAGGLGGWYVATGWNLLAPVSASANSALAMADGWEAATADGLGGWYVAAGCRKRERVRCALRRDSKEP